MLDPNSFNIPSESNFTEHVKKSFFSPSSTASTMSAVCQQIARSSQPLQNQSVSPNALPNSLKGDAMPSAQ